MAADRRKTRTPSPRPRQRAPGRRSPRPARDTGCILVLSTAGGEGPAGEIAGTLVGESLAACVSLVPGVRSVYRWKGEVCRDEEVLLVIKTTRALYPALERRLRALHPYECPEIVMVPIAAGYEPYLDWLAGSVREALYTEPAT